MRAQVPRPAARGDRAHSGDGIEQGGPVEGNEDSARMLRVWPLGACEGEDRRIGKRGRVFDDPSFAPHRDAIAGCQAHARLFATRVPCDAGRRGQREIAENTEDFDETPL